jgi:ATP/maltotriose-dependent transcriptional regulator MalT
MVLLRELASAFGELSRDHQEVICLIAVEGMSYEDVAATLDVSVGTVKSRLSRARRELRQIMDGQAHVQTVRRATNPTRASDQAKAEIEAHFDRLLTSSEVSDDRRALAA